MAYPIQLREKVVNLRRWGRSLKELHEITGVSKSRLSDWVSDVALSDFSRRRLLGKIKKGQLVSTENKRKRTSERMQRYFLEAQRDVRRFQLNRERAKILCALLYWCEGVKDESSGVRFVNSDPALIKTFLSLLRASFDTIDERKFRVCVHLHSYHLPERELRFWSRVTNIPLAQFTKPFQKKNTGKRVRDGYNGCASIRYHDNAVGRQLLMTATAFLSQF